MKVTVTQDQAEQLLDLLANTEDPNLQAVARKLDHGQRANNQLTSDELGAAVMALHLGSDLLSVNLVPLARSARQKLLALHDLTRKREIQQGRQDFVVRLESR